MKLLSCGAALIIAAGALSTTSAQAGVESAYYGAVAPNLPGECKQTQDRGDAQWRPSEGRLVIVGQGSVEIEFFGHFFDMIKEASITGINGARARVDKGYNGTFNNIDRHCGGIGSVVVVLNFEQPNAPSNGILHLDDQEIPITIKPRTVASTRWEDAYPTSNSPSNSSSNSSPSGSLPPGSAQPGGVRLEGAPNCDPSNCGGGGTTAFVVGGRPSGGRTGVSRSTNLLGCAVKYGLTFTQNSNTNLTVTLPQVRLGPIEACLRDRDLEFKINYSNLAPGEHFRAGGYFSSNTPTRVSVSANGGLPVFNNTNKEPNGTEAEFDVYGFRIDGNFLKSFVGRKIYNIDPQPGINLTLQLVSSPEYGVKTLAGPVYPQAVGRLNSAVNVRLTPYSPTAANQPFAWKVTGPAIPAETCFEQISGAVTPPAGESTVVIALTATDREGCAGKNFTVSAYPSVVPPFGQDTAFEKQVTFVLPPKQKTFVQSATATPNVPESVGAGLRRP